MKKNSLLRKSKIHVAALCCGLILAPCLAGAAGQSLPADHSTQNQPANHRPAAQKLIEEGTRLQAQHNSEAAHQSIEKYQAALEVFHSAGNTAGEARMLTAIGMVHHSLGELEPALEFFNRALPLCQTLGNAACQAEVLNHIGVTHSHAGRKQKAIEFLNQALQLEQTAGNQSGEAYTLSMIGMASLSLGRTQAALELYSRALQIRRATGDRQGEALSLTNIGSIYKISGQVQKAFDCYQQALPILHSLDDHSAEAFALANLGGLYMVLGEKQKGLEYQIQALQLQRAAGDVPGEAQMLNNLGMAYASLGEKQRALDYYQQALSLRRRLHDVLGEADVLSNLGAIYRALGEPQKALDMLNQALPIKQTSGDRRAQAGTLQQLGLAYRDLGEQQKALNTFRQVVALNREVGDKLGQAIGLYESARVERGLGNLPTARQSMESSLALVETIRADVGSQELRASFFSTARHAYEFYIDLLMQMHQQTPSAGYDAEALQVSERARARSLLELLVEARADLRQGVDPTVLERERALQRQLNAKEQEQVHLLSHQHTDEQATAGQRELETLLAEYQEVEAKIRTTSPGYAALTQPSPLSLKDIQRQVLDGDTLLLEYVLGQERSFLWAVTPTSITSYELPKRLEIEAAARRAYELLTTSQRREAKRQAELAAAELSHMVLGPVAGQLGKKRLLVVCEGALQYVPFAALPLPKDEGSKVKDEKKKPESLYPSSFILHPLVEDHEVVSLPSASTLSVLRQGMVGRQPAEKLAAVLADPVLQSNDPRIKSGKKGQPSKMNSQSPASDLTRSAEDSGITSFERLRFTRQEAEAIVSQAPDGKILKALDFAACRATALNAELNQYSYVHFATHGIINSRHPELSGLVLSLVDEAGQPQDGFVRVHEIYNLKLNADVVVLSACRTALGREIKGEGLVGMVYGFMYAGAPRVVASLWDVKDEATAELMKRFYQGMLGPQRLRPAAALRAAQISMWQEPQWKAPFYWAAFQIQGEWR